MRLFWCTATVLVFYSWTCGDWRWQRMKDIEQNFMQRLRPLAGLIATDFCWWGSGLDRNLCSD